LPKTIENTDFLAATIPWNEIEEKYAALFPSKKGMPAKPLRTALGSLIIQKQSDHFWESCNIRC